MCSALYCVGRGFCIVALLASAVGGQDPTLSLEIVAVNSNPLESPASEITAGPGEILTLDIFARDFSPNGEPVRAMQATIDPQGFTSGHSGTVQPVDFDKTSEKGLENKANGFVDLPRDTYIFGEKRTIAVVDTVSPGYRFLNVVITREDARVCPTKDGTKYYCGTLKVRVSDDALGPFKLGFIEDPGATALRGRKSFAIPNLRLESATINVVRDAVPLRVVESHPPRGAIDARQPPSGNNPAGGWDVVDLRFNGDAGGLEPGDFRVEDGTAGPPHIKELVANGSVLTLQLDRGIRDRKWTMITHVASNTGTRLGCLPGDVDNNRMIGIDDLFRLIGSLQDAEAMPLYQVDIDRDGNASLTDALRLIDLLNRRDVHRAVLPHRG